MLLCNNHMNSVLQVKVYNLIPIQNEIVRYEECERKKI